MFRTLLSTSAVILLAGTAGATTIPMTMGYQGFLTDSTGVEFADGVYDFGFRIYDVEIGGAPLWTETQSLEVTAGVFSAVLGSVAPIGIDFDAPLYLGFSVDGGAELDPRVPLTAVPYSFHTKAVADSAVTGASLADGAVVRSLNGLTDAVSLVAGENVTIVDVGQELVISASGGGGGGGNTLDQAYDEGGPGVGRTITADSGAVEIVASGPTGALTIDQGGPGDGIDIDHTSTGDAIDITHSGDGLGITILSSGAGEGVSVAHAGTAPGIKATHSGSNDAIRASHGIDPLGDAVHAVQEGAGNAVTARASNTAIGHGVQSMVENAASDGDAVHGETIGSGDAVHGESSGTGFGVYGLKGADPSPTEPTKAGVGGESTDQAGVAGYSENSSGVSGKSRNDDGVYGYTSESGTYGRGLSSLKGGVHGVAPLITGTADAFGVIGESPYGTGVFGVGGETLGHGVLGLSGPVGPGSATTFGVRGVTRGAPWSIDDATGKKMVGVMGQTDAHVAVWGESASASGFGVVGTIGDTFGRDDLPDETAAVYGQTIIGGGKNGVHGYAASADKDDAGVVAQGRGGSTGTTFAAALEVRDGAIRVSGPARPASRRDPGSAGARTADLQLRQHLSQREPPTRPRHRVV